MSRLLPVVRPVVDEVPQAWAAPLAKRRPRVYGGLIHFLMSLLSATAFFGLVLRAPGFL